MVQGGYGGVLDTPRTNIGDATYLSRGPDFADISQEASFHSPQKDSGNILQQLRNQRSNGHGSGVSLRTPRRDPLTDRNNLPPSIGGAEFTPLLKSATRNSARRRGGKENGTMSLSPNLSRIDENDLTPVPRMDASMYSASRNQSYLDHTIPQIDSSSVTSTPLAMATRRGGDKGPLQDGNQLSLREQENVIDKIEKENFGLKLKIHFLEEALRKAGPGFHEAALKENTELKVDKATMQREAHRFKKNLITAERELETCRQQIQDLQSRVSHTGQDDGLRAEMQALRRQLDEKEEDIRNLNRQLAAGQDNQEQLEKLQDTIEDLEADLRDKDRQLTEREDEAEDFKDKIEDAQARVREAEKRAQEAEENGQDSDELDEAKETIQDLEQNIRRLEEQVDELNQKLEAAATEKDRAEQDLEELQEEMANKSVVTKGLSRQIDERVTRLQDELDKAGEDYASLEKEYTEANGEIDELKAKVDQLEHEQATMRQGNPESEARILELEAELQAQIDEKDLIQTRHDTLTAESTTLQRDVQRLQMEVEDLESSVAKERDYAVEIEKDLRAQYQDELGRLNDDISDLEAEIREKDNIYDNDSEKWETEKQTLEAERNRAEEKANGLQRIIDRLREAEGSLSDRGSKLQDGLKMEEERHRSEEALMTRQIDDLQDALETRQKMLTDLRSELSTVRDDLRQAQVDYRTQENKVISLEDQVEALRNRPAVTTPARREGEALKRECESLREQLRTLRLSTEGSRGAAEGTPIRGSQTPTRLKWQLTDANTKLEKVSLDKRSVEDNLASIRAELRSTQTSLAEVSAERDELDSQLRRTKLHDNDTLRVDQERLDLRTAKLKLDGEVRRLRDENKGLAEQRASVEKSLESEIEKATAEEERLNQEIMQLQAKLRQASSAETTDNSTTRRTIRDLERRVDEYQAELASAQALLDGDGGSSEVSIIRRDLTSARQKEVEFLQREATSKDVIKGLRREIADLESKLHDNEVLRMMGSPNSSSQMANATYGGSHVVAEELQQELDDAEDQRVVLEEFLEEARQQAEEMAAEYAQSLQRLQHQLDKALRDRETAVAAATAATAAATATTATTASPSKNRRSKEARHLQKTQAEIDNLEHDVRQQQALIESLVASEVALRRKLERTRSERAAYRVSAEKLRRDVVALQRGAGLAEAETALATVVRAADAAQDRHRKEVGGLVTQMDWMQARWEREAMMRTDAAYAKKFIQLQLDISSACNKAQLRELEHIRTNLLHSRKPLQLLPSSSPEERQKPTLRTFLVLARFVARMRLAARKWAAQERVRRKLVAATDERRKAKRVRGLRVVRVDEDNAAA
ncbi:Spindle associated [Cordyceps militaris CM01]|uniref:Spindle associated n=1 Tax=Cordyceps militaris (strain CM01) TaxID=983644 RepID=G3J428_CORMM|nr:Spindle associated [Cordyceps militaris CM01]EGX96599.1 Spindle associated [Cordyceps militaris CM01]